MYLRLMRNTNHRMQVVGVVSFKRMIEICRTRKDGSQFVAIRPEWNIPFKVRHPELITAE